MDDHSYLREVERYFLEATGQGVMLSSRDYDLIQGWKSRGVPKDVVLRGIRRALRDYKERHKGGSPKSIYSCSDAIEREIKSYYSSSRGEPLDPEDKSDLLLDELVARLAEIISTEKNERLRKLYAEIREKVLDFRGLDEEQLFRKVEETEQALYESFFESIDESLQQSIIEDAKGMIHKGGKYMTSEAFQQSLTHYRNQILEQKFNIRKLLKD